MTVFQPIAHSRSAEEVAHQIEALVLEGVLRSGDQLPGERELAQRVAVSRPIVREAIALLEARGLLIRHHGGGTFVGDVIGQVFSEPVAALLPDHPKATADYLEYRREIEAIAAGLAAERATRYDLEMLEDVTARMASAHDGGDFEAEAQADVEFHSLVGEMAHNLVLLHTLRSCYRLLSRGVFDNRLRLYETEGGRQALFDQHMAIAGAIRSGDAKTASQAARAHIDYVLDKSNQIARQAERERVSGLRFQQRNEA